MNGATQTSSGKTVPTTFGGIVRYMVAEHGFVGLVCCALAVGFYCFGLKPMQEGQQKYRDTLEQSVSDGKVSQDAIVESTERIAESVDKQQVATEKLSDTLDDIAVQNQAEQVIIETFREQVMKDHPEQSQKLDRILEKMNTP